MSLLENFREYLGLLSMLTTALLVGAGTWLIFSGLVLFFVEGEGLLYSLGGLIIGFVGYRAHDIVSDLIIFGKLRR